MRISDWSSDVCSSDLIDDLDRVGQPVGEALLMRGMEALPRRVDVDRAVGPTRNRDLHGMLLADVAHVEEMLDDELALAIILDGLPFDRVETARNRSPEASRVGKDCVSTCRSR